jgi:hypothetical protein
MRRFTGNFARKIGSRLLVQNNNASLHRLISDHGVVGIRWAHGENDSEQKSSRGALLRAAAEVNLVLLMLHVF